MKTANPQQPNVALVLLEPLVSALVLCFLIYPWARPHDVPAMIWIISLSLVVNLAAVCLRTHAGRAAAYVFNPLIAGLLSGVMAVGVILYFYGIEIGFEVVATLAMVVPIVVAVGSYVSVWGLKSATATYHPAIGGVLATIVGAALVGTVTAKLISYGSYYSQLAVARSSANLAAVRHLAQTGGEDKTVQLIAIGRLGNVHDEAAIPMLTNLAGSQDKDVRTRAVAALATIGTPDAQQQLVELIRTGSLEAVDFVRMYGRAWHNASVGLALIDSLHSNDAELLRRAALALRELEIKQAIPTLVAKLPQASTRAQEAIICAIIELTGESFGYNRDDYRSGYRSGVFDAVIRRIQDWWKDHHGE
jgi:hypothetical protein